jgi:hypothetical protein
MHVPIVLKFGKISLLETSGPVQGCTGIAFVGPGIAWLVQRLATAWSVRG